MRTNRTNRTTRILTFTPLALVFAVDAWRRLLGLRPASDLYQAHYYLAGGISARVAAAVVIAGALWFGYLYLRDGTRPTLWVKGPMLLLRLTALSTLLFMLLQPMVRVTKTDRIRSNVVVLLDDSQSMDQKDARLPRDLAGRVARAVSANPAELDRKSVV